MNLHAAAIILALVSLTSAASAELCLIEITRELPPNNYSMAVLCEKNISRCNARPPNGFCIKTPEDTTVRERHCTVVKTCTPV